jgi:hypothetical protein
MPGCISFRDAPLEHEEQMWIMFDAISVTNETSFVPSTKGDECKGATADGGVDNNEVLVVLVGLTTMIWVLCVMLLSLLWRYN